MERKGNGRLAVSKWKRGHFSVSQTNNTCPSRPHHRQRRALIPNINPISQSASRQVSCCKSTHSASQSLFTVCPSIIASTAATAAVIIIAVFFSRGSRDFGWKWKGNGEENEKRKGEKGKLAKSTGIKRVTKGIEEE